MSSVKNWSLQYFKTIGGPSCGIDGGERQEREQKDKIPYF